MYIIMKYMKHNTCDAAMTPAIGRRNLVLGALPLLASAAFASRATLAAAAADSASRCDNGATAEQVTLGIDLTGRTALVTGCSSGLGQETVRVLVLRGARVYGLAPTLAKAQSGCAAANIPGVSGNAIPLACD